MITGLNLISNPNGLISYVAERIEQHKANLQGWLPPYGYLMRTEPDPEIRAEIRAELRAAIYELEQLQQFFDGAKNSV